MHYHLPGTDFHSIYSHRISALMTSTIIIIIIINIITGYYYY